MRHQPIIKSPLSIWGIILIAGGIIFNIKMFIEKGYTLTSFSILIIFGFVFIVIDLFIRYSRNISLKLKLLIQVILILFPLIGFYVTYEVILPRAQVILVKENFYGPYAIVYDIPGYPPIEKKGRDLILRIPINGILVTSDKMHEVKIETYRIQNVDTQNGIEIVNKFGGTHFYSSDCGSYSCYYGYISNNLSDISFNEDVYFAKLYKMLCDKKLLSR